MGKEVRIYHIIQKTFRCNDIAQAFGCLEKEFRKKPDGFYKFLAPCKHEDYKKGDSLSEEMYVSRSTARRYLNKFVKSYNSKTLYEKAKAELGEMGVFCGMPYLSYTDNNSNKTFYMQNKTFVEALFSGGKPPFIDTGNVVFVDFRQDQNG